MEKRMRILTGSLLLCFLTAASAVSAAWRARCTSAPARAALAGFSSLSRGAPGPPLSPAPPALAHRAGVR